MQPANEIILNNDTDLVVAGFAIARKSDIHR